MRNFVTFCERSMANRHAAFLFLIGKKAFFVYVKGSLKTNLSLIYRTFFLRMSFGAINEPVLKNLNCHLIKLRKRTLSVLSLSVSLLVHSLQLK